MSPTWLDVLRRYVLFSTLAHPLWEMAQLPLYTIWTTGSRRELVVAVAHCSAGDLLIAVSSLILALLVAGSGAWPGDAREFRRVTWLATVVGVLYTVFSEWLNMEVRGSWGYSAAMPVLPILGTGLAPLVQWLVIPPLALWLARGRRARD